MKTVILAGGLGSRISEESVSKPKPMIEIGGKPILWHILKIYQAYGFNEFVICLGYKGHIIKEYFANYFLYNEDVTFDLATNQIEIHSKKTESLKVTLIETGLNTMTAGRLQKVKQYIDNKDFMLTYGDGVSNVNIKKLLEFHKSHGKIATVTTIQPSGKFGVLEADETGLVQEFVEKPKVGGTWINGGFFVLKPEIFNYLQGNIDSVMWEQEPMANLVKNKELVSYKHTGFWKCMDILRDKEELEKMWATNPVWKVWK